MKYYVPFILLLCFLVVLPLFAGKKSLAREKNQKPIEAAITIEGNIDCDSAGLQHQRISLLDNLREQSELQPLNASHINSFIFGLMSDTLTDPKQHLDFYKSILSDLQSLKLENERPGQQFSSFIAALEALTRASGILRSKYNTSNIQQAIQELTQIKEGGELNHYVAEETDFLLKGLDYYNRKVVLRRIRDLAEDLLALRNDSNIIDNNTLYTIDDDTKETDSVNVKLAWSARFDSLYQTAIGHKGRNHLISYVPYADSLRSKIEHAFYFDECNHILIDRICWNTIEAIKKEMEDIIGN